MDFRYHVDLHTLDNSLTPSKVFSTSLQTDPDLYALKNKKKNNGCRSNQLELKHLLKDTPIPHLVSTNRIAYVEALVDINAVVIESIWYPTTPYPQLKESRVSPVVPLRTFIQEVLKRSRTTYSTLQTALFYIFRVQPSIVQQLQQEGSWQHNAYISCGRRMFLASLVVASKFVQDKTYRNSAWAKIAGLPVQEINTAERYFLELINYQLYIDQPTFDHWHRLLHMRTQARMHHIPTSLYDLASCLSSFPSSLPSPPLSSLSYPPSPVCETPSSVNTCINSPGCHYACMCAQCSLKAPGLSLSLPSSISSSPAHTPIQVSPIRLHSSKKRKFEGKDHSLLDKKHCRFWQ
ncbi:G1/S-specific cyclin pas1 [Choanephora cucurbitarum]|uniref:G1/S-specific cyclin pas1 n=1 Tax=Choanephora cucurbitarum TaxID=101091 RepID=A0A1C7NRR9_9FUNG|nr:G1/S-specific cyclin pas1 [Choanephora cucurbitarum]